MYPVTVPGPKWKSWLILRWLVMDIEFTVDIFKEGQQYVAHSPELDVSSCAHSTTKARENLMVAARLFLEEADKMGTLEQVLRESGYARRGEAWQAPRFVSRHSASVALPLVHVKTY